MENFDLFKDVDQNLIDLSSNDDAKIEWFLWLNLTFITKWSWPSYSFW
jgi:hypothetical protein